MRLLCFPSPKCCLRHMLVHDCAVWPEAEPAGAAVLSPGLCRVIFGDSPGALLPRVPTSAQFRPAFGRARALTRRSSSSGGSRQDIGSARPSLAALHPGEAALETRAPRLRPAETEVGGGWRGVCGSVDVVHERSTVQPSLRLCLVPPSSDSPWGRGTALPSCAPLGSRRSSCSPSPQDPREEMMRFEDRTQTPAGGQTLASNNRDCFWAKDPVNPGPES